MCKEILSRLNLRAKKQPETPVPQPQESQPIPVVPPIPTPDWLTREGERLGRVGSLYGIEESQRNQRVEEQARKPRPRIQTKIEGLDPEDQAKV